MTLNGSYTTWRVLVIDDEPDILKLVVQILRVNGATAEPAASGAEGLEKVKTFKPNVIILDLQMPDIDGWEVQRRLRQSPGLAHVPIIALTAHALPGDAEQVIEAGFDGYIGKPFRMKSLLAMLKDKIERFVAVRGREEGRAEMLASSGNILTGSVIVVVDDDRDSRRLLHDILVSAGAKVHQAGSGDECFELLQSITPNLIILDLEMPPPNGWDVLSVMRLKPSTAKIPVAAVTAYTSSSVASRARQAGFVGFFEKPIKYDLLIEDVKRLLDAPRNPPPRIVL